MSLSKKVESSWVEPASHVFGKQACHIRQHAVLDILSSPTWFYVHMPGYGCTDINDRRPILFVVYNFYFYPVFTVKLTGMGSICGAAIKHVKELCCSGNGQRSKSIKVTAKSSYH